MRTRGVTVHVSDGQGAYAEQSYSVVVSATPPDAIPVIESQPALVGRVGFLYTYRMGACDPDHDTLQFQLRQGPAGMTIDANTGLVQWTPTAIGTYTVGVAAVDPAGKTGQQWFRIVVAVNHAPSITSSPITSETAGWLYRYDVRATDPDLDLLTYQLDSVSLARGMRIDGAGRRTARQGV